MKRKIWIMNHYASLMYCDHGGRHYNFAKYLKQSGYEPVVFCCNAKHGKAETYFPDRGLWQEHLAEEISVPFVFVRGRTYTGNGKQRMLNMIDFYRNVKKAVKEYAFQHDKPDVIYASSVHPLTLVAGIQLAKYFGVKCICEVRDLWPESIVVSSTRINKSNPIIKLLYRGERWIYKKADAIIFTMEGGYDYIVEQGWEKDIPQSKVYYINNGVDLEQFHYNMEHYQIDDPDLNNPDLFKVVYTGSIRPANNVGLIIECAEKLLSYPDIHFLIYGDGEDFFHLNKVCAERNIRNCVLKGSIKKEYIPYILSKSNLNLLNYDQTSAKILRFGSSQNKLFEYLASGKPILGNAELAYSPIDRFYCGRSRIPQDSSDYAQEILNIYRCPKEKREEMGKNAKKAAEKYDFKFLSKKLIGVIEKV